MSLKLTGDHFLSHTHVIPTCLDAYMEPDLLRFIVCSVISSFLTYLLHCILNCFMYYKLWYNVFF